MKSRYSSSSWLDGTIPAITPFFIPISQHKSGNRRMRERTQEAFSLHARQIQQWIHQTSTYRRERSEPPCSRAWRVNPRSAGRSQHPGLVPGIICIVRNTLRVDSPRAKGMGATIAQTNHGDTLFRCEARFNFSRSLRCISTITSGLAHPFPSGGTRFRWGNASTGEKRPFLAKDSRADSRELARKL